MKDVGFALYVNTFLYQCVATWMLKDKAIPTIKDKL